MKSIVYNYKHNIKIYIKGWAPLSPQNAGSALVLALLCKTSPPLRTGVENKMCCSPPQNSRQICLTLQIHFFKQYIVYFSNNASIIESHKMLRSSTLEQNTLWKCCRDDDTRWQKYPHKSDVHEQQPEGEWAISAHASLLYPPRLSKLNHHRFGTLPAWLK